MLNKLVSAALTIVVALGVGNVVLTQQIAAVEACNPQNTANSNHECYWQAKYLGSTCIKYEGVSLTQNLQNGDPTKFVVPSPPAGTSYVAAIVNAANTDSEKGAVSANAVLSISVGGTIRDISHVILCYKNSVQALSGTLNVSSTCESITFGATGVTPEGTTVAFKLDGDDKTAGTYPVSAGSHTIQLFLNGKQEDSKTIDVEACEDEGTPGVAVSLVCPVNTYTLTVANSGDTDLEVEINGTKKMLAADDPAIKADFKVGDVLSASIDGEPVTVEGKVLKNFTLQTCQGMGSTTTTSSTNPPAGTTVVASTGFGSGAATGVASLPVTSGSSAQAAAAIVSFGSILAAAGIYLSRTRNGMVL